MNSPRRLVVRLAALSSFAFLAAACAHAGADGKGGTTPAAESAAAKPQLPCTVENKDDDSGSYTCAEVTGNVATTKAAAKAALDQYVKETEKALKGAGKLRRAPAKLEDLDVTGLKVTVNWKGGSKPPTETYVWTIPLKGETGLITCIAKEGGATLDQCHTGFIDLMKTLAAMDDSSGSEDAGGQGSVDEKTLFGKEIKVADGCQTKRLNPQMMALDCGPAKLMWNDFGKTDETEGFLDGVEHETRAKFKVTTRSESACTIDGRSTSCRRIAANLDGKKLVFYFGLSQYAGHTLLVECVYAGEGASPPAPCNDVIASKKR